MTCLLLSVAFTLMMWLEDGYANESLSAQMKTSRLRERSLMSAAELSSTYNPPHGLEITRVLSKAIQGSVANFA